MRHGPSDGTEEDHVYVLGRLLESGRNGDLHETTHPLVPGRCAIRVLPPALTRRVEALQAFEADVRALAALRHPNLLPIVDVGTQPDGSSFVVTERLEGRLLSERLSEQGALPPVQVAEIVRGIAAGLQAAHNLGIVHGELHPANVFLARTEGYPQGVVKLSDFGLARLRPVDALPSLPADTIRFLAPEQAAGRAEEIDGRSDQFTLALVAFRMLCGADAFAGDSALSLLYELVHGQPAFDVLVTGNAELEAVLRRALSRDRSDRFESVVAFARALATSVGGESTAVTARPTPAPLPTARPTPPPFTLPPITIVAAMPPAPVQAPAAVPDADPFLTHPFFSREDQPRRRRRRVVLVRPPRDPGPRRLFLLFCAVAVASVAGALAVGWRPPLSWRQSQLWHELRLPGAAAPEATPPR
jgi:serine/threonine-protein kinase